MDDAGLDGGKISGRHARLDLAVEGVARLQRDLLTLADLDNRRDVGMVSVVAEMRLVGDRLCPIDADPVHAAPLSAAASPGS
jgi:hypothetical protein